MAQRYFAWQPPEKNAAQAILEEFRQEAVYVALEEGLIVGVISLWSPDAFVHYLFVDPQGRGIGSKLLTLASTLFDRPLTLKCAESNLNALRFYARAGFVPVEWGGEGVQRWVRLQAGLYP